MSKKQLQPITGRTSRHTPDTTATLAPMQQVSNHISSSKLPMQYSQPRQAASPVEVQQAQFASFEAPSLTQKNREI